MIHPMPEDAEPTFDATERPCLILDLPVLSDEAALQLGEFLYAFAERFEDHYSAQIRRAHRARESERDQLYRQRLHLEAQQPLPFDDDPF
ncbi:MAG: hypothetical protein WBE91_09385 [Steroidobacteraceae bacterium]